MANRFETVRGGFADMAVARRKQPKTFLDDVDRIIDWKPMESFLKKKLRRHRDAVGNPAYPALGLFQVLLLQRWHDLSDHKTSEAKADRISFCRFAGFSLDHESPDASTICRFRNHLEERGFWVKAFDMINGQLGRHGILVRSGTSVGATLIPSAKHPRKSEEVIPDELAEDSDNDDGDRPSGYTMSKPVIPTIRKPAGPGKARSIAMVTKGTSRWIPGMASSSEGMPPPPTGPITRNSRMSSGMRNQARAPRYWRTRATAARPTETT